MRTARTSRDAQIEANHLHNIPGLLDKFSVDLLQFYIDVERPRYVTQTNDQVLEEMRGAWSELADWLRLSVLPWGFVSL